MQETIRLGFHGVSRLKSTILPELKVNVHRLSPLPIQNPYSKLILGLNFLFLNQFSKILPHILRQWRGAHLVVFWPHTKSLSFFAGEQPNMCTYVSPTEGEGGHIAFGADPVGVRVASFLHSGS